MKKGLAVVGLAGACAVCCAPLLVPALASAGLAGAGGIGAGLLAGVSIDAIICGALPLMGVAGYAVYAYRRRKAPETACHCQSACHTASCAPGSDSAARR